MTIDTYNNELLTDDELIIITGFKCSRKQREWLERNGWLCHVNAANRPVVGRFYARSKLSGINNQTLNNGWRLELGRVT